jgi:N utilization substance protein B
MSKRRNARELALKVLFQVDVGHLSPDEALQTWEEEVRPAAEDRDYVDELVRGIASSEAELDEIIAELAEGWKIDRLAKVDKNVLRIALYELIHHPDSTPNTVVNDAVEVVKKYSTDDSGRFVNGILGSYLRRREETNPASRK